MEDLGTDGRMILEQIIRK